MCPCTAKRTQCVELIGNNKVNIIILIYSSTQSQLIFTQATDIQFPRYKYPMMSLALIQVQDWVIYHHYFGFLRGSIYLYHRFNNLFSTISVSYFVSLSLSANSSVLLFLRCSSRSGSSLVLVAQSCAINNPNRNCFGVYSGWDVLATTVIHLTAIFLL